VNATSTCIKSSGTKGTWTLYNNIICACTIAELELVRVCVRICMYIVYGTQHNRKFHFNSNCGIYLKERKGKETILHTDSFWVSHLEKSRWLSFFQRVKATSLFFFKLGVCMCVCVLCRMQKEWKEGRGKSRRFKAFLENRLLVVAENPELYYYYGRIAHSELDGRRSFICRS